MYDKEIRPVQDKTLRYSYFMDKEHPLSDAKGRVWLHRHVASISAGRWLIRSEIVHHIDGDRTNNMPGNLVVTTAAEHAKIHNPIKRTKKKCGPCRNKFIPITSDQKTCSVKCNAILKNRTLCLVSREELASLVWKKPSTSIAKELGVSDTAVSKMCRKLGIKKPPRGYWAKFYSKSAP